MTDNIEATPNFDLDTEDVLELEFDSDAHFGAEEFDNVLEMMGGKVENDAPVPQPAQRHRHREEKVYEEEPEGDIDANILPGDMLSIIYAEIDKKKIAGHHIDSMNSFNQVGIKQIATKVFVVEGRNKNSRDKTEEDREIAEIAFRVEFTDINLSPPTTVKYKSGSIQILTPNMARIKSLTYSAQMSIDATITATATFKNGSTKTRTAEFKNHRIASIPCQVGTELCNTSNMTKSTLKNIEEDPRGVGGYFIIKGLEWTIDNLENITNNTFHVYKNMYGNEIARGTFLSKPGDAFENSYQVILRYLNNGAITIEITTNKFDKFEIPYYLIFRALGMTRDRDIVNHIVYGIDQESPVTRDMLQILEQAFEVDDAKFGPIRKSTDSAEIIKFIAQKITDTANSAAARRDDNVTKYLNASILSIIDRYIFPHVGVGIEHRIKKLRFLGHLINKLLCVRMGVLEPSDRDSYRNKRVFAAGTSMAKTFKTDFNFAIVQEVKKQLTKDFKTTPFSQVQLSESVRAAINSDELERLLTQAITTGNKTITVRRTEIINRISSQTLYHKNDMNVKSTMGTVNTPNTSAAKQNERADVMRRVHATYMGYIDISQSADSGEKVGMTKQMACTASICGSSSSAILKSILAADPDLLSLDDVRPEQITAEKLAKVFVNGDWIGCCRESHNLVYKYRVKRRHNDIHHLTTIVWEPLIREVYFWTDVGRLMRPLVIVYNNINEYIKEVRGGNKTFVFKQWIKLTKEHINGLRTHAVTMDDLRVQRVIEYISPEEQESTFIAPNIDTLRSHVNDVRFKYTHCDIEQAIFGIVTLAGPMANHSNAVRNTMYTNHRKQAAGWYALNFPYRIDKNATLQHYCERPLISTFSDALTNPNGLNTIVALMLHGGENCEDSLKLNQSSIDCGAYQASHYNYEKAELDKGEQFGNPDYARTMDIKKEGIYEYVKGGFIAEGTRVGKGYVLIVKAAKIPKPIDQYIYIDKSIVYKRDEPVYIERVVTTRNDEDIQITKVKYRANRPLGVGDKLCLDKNHEVLTSDGWIPIADVTLSHKIMTLVGWRHPYELHAYDHDGDTYLVETDYISQHTTLNHKMYVDRGTGFELVPAEQIIDQEVVFMGEKPCKATGKLSSYTGKVYCVTVPSHVFYVRRNGKPSWTGNSSRSGNKGICAIKVPRCDMPYCEDGLIPDVIVNAHSIPTRMAVNQITECVLAQLAARQGTFIDATPFRNQDIDGALKKLETEYGVRYGGHRRMYNGMTGMYIDTLIFIGPTTYQRLQKFVIDEQYAIRTGPTSALTRQPLDGKNNDGGLRLGEMEKDCLSVAGVMRALFGKFYDDSDGITLPICRICGNRAIVNEKMGIYKCKTCGDQADIVNVDSAWVANIFFHEASAMNIKLNFELEPFKFTKMEKQ